MLFRTRSRSTASLTAFEMVMKLRKRLCHPPLEHYVHLAAKGDSVAVERLVSRLEWLLVRSQHNPTDVEHITATLRAVEREFTAVLPESVQTS